MKRRRSGLLTFLLVAAVLLAVAGVILVSMYFYLRGSTELPTALPEEPWAAVEVEAISPPLALRTLAGEEEVDTVRAALSVGDLDSTYATLVFSSSLSDAERTAGPALHQRRTGGEGRRLPPAGALADRS
jgi:hypothetical protein